MRKYHPQEKGSSEKFDRVYPRVFDSKCAYFVQLVVALNH